MKLKNDEKSLPEDIMTSFTIDDDLIECHVKEIERSYKKHSLLEKISDVKYSKNANLDFKKISYNCLIPSEIFMRLEQNMEYDEESSDYDMSILEICCLYEHLVSTLELQNSMNDSDSILMAVKKMQNDGFKPNVIFIPFDTLLGLENRIPVYKMNLKLDGKVFTTIKSCSGCLFTGIVIYDSRYLKITLADEMSVSVNGKNNRNIKFVCTINAHFAIQNSKAFTYIRPKNHSTAHQKIR